MLLSAFLMLVALALIIKGGDLFVSASVRIAEFLRLPRVVIGSTLVSLTTTSPELVVSVVSGLKNEPGLAVGNAVGSCICNIGLILGTMALLKHVEVHVPTLKVPFTAMVVAGVLLLAMTLDLHLSRLQGLILVFLGAVYFVIDFIRHERDTAPADIAEATALEEEVVQGHPWLHTQSGTALQFACGAALVLFGSWLLVKAAVQIATSLGVPPIFIGLTIVAVGTSLPEFVTAITSARKNVSDLAVGNILGANVANLTLIIGAAASLSDLTLSRQTQLFNFPAMLVLMVLLLLTMFSGNQISRREGLALLSYYACYIIILVIMTMTG